MKKLWEWRQNGKIIYYTSVEPNLNSPLIASHFYKLNGVQCIVGEPIKAEQPKLEQFTECTEYPDWFRLN